MKKSSRFLSLLLSIIMILSMLSVSSLAAETTGLDNFKKVNSYNNSTYSDVKSDAWFYDNVKSAFEYGLMVGKGSNQFDTMGNVTIAETLAIAARLHSTYYTGKANFEQSSPWYQVYADYCKANGIANSSAYNLTASATRAQFAQILANAMPNDAWKSINKITDNAIPDVKATDSFGTAVYKLYRAGVLTGSDSKGSFLPASNIKRSEVAAIVTRMAVPSLRKAVQLGDDRLVNAEDTVSIALGDDLRTKQITFKFKERGQTGAPNTPNYITAGNVKWECVSYSGENPNYNKDYLGGGYIVLNANENTKIDTVNTTLPYGKFKMTFSAPDYKDETVEFAVDKNTTLVNIFMTPTSRTTESVFAIQLINDRPGDSGFTQGYEICTTLPGVKTGDVTWSISIEDGSNEFGGSLIEDYTGYWDEGDGYKQHIVPGVIYWVDDGGGYKAYTVHAQYTYNGKTYNAEFYHPASAVRAYSVTGYVFDKETNKPLAGADVFVYDKNGIGPLYNGRTDGSGNYNIGINVAGTYNLKFMKDGYETYAWNGLIVDGNVKIDRVYLTPQSETPPVSPDTITITNLDYTWYGFVSGKRGQFTLEGLISLSSNDTPTISTSWGDAVNVSRINNKQYSFSIDVWDTYYDSDMDDGDVLGKIIINAGNKRKEITVIIEGIFDVSFVY